MIQLSRLGLLATAAVLLPWTSTLAPAVDPKVELRPIKYDDLGRQIRSMKGRVVVVDLWADFCPPCKREFPHLVELKEKYGKEGLVAVSVALDRPDDQAGAGRIAKFLEDRKAVGVINYILEEGPELWQKKFKIEGPPAVFVFDQDNRIALRLPVGNDNVDYAVVEQTVKELLKR